MNAKQMRKGILLAWLASILFFFPATAQSQTTHADHAESEYPANFIADERLDDVLAAYTANGDLQTERPEWTPEPQKFTPRRNGRPNALIRAIAAFFTALGPLLGYILLGLVVVIILAALYFIFGESLTLRGKQKPAKTQPDLSAVPNLRPEQGEAMALLEDADALAAAGRFAEAVHLLLFRSIGDIQERRQGSVTRALTAREIGRLDALPGRVRDALSPIIQLVERSYFGGRNVDESGWNTARASYQDFAFGEVWA